MKKFLMYGAGNIGRGFIGQIFSSNNYSVGFIDVNMEVIDRLNKDHEYPVGVVSNEGTNEIIVKNVYGIDGKNLDLIADEISKADVMATAIGVNVLKFIAKPIALGLKKRMETNSAPLNIIICENLIGADEYLKGLILEAIPEIKDYINTKVGFVEASVGRMVPVMSDDKKQGNPLRINVEPYNILPIDKAAMKQDINDCTNLYPFSPFNLFIQRKLFMHNMSHAVCAYLGFLRDYQYIYECVADYDIKYVAYKCLMTSALAVSKENKVPFDILFDHANDLLYRFSNKALGDTVSRVGKDTKRKLSNNDRLVGALNLCEKQGVDGKFLCIGIAAGMLFNPEGDDSSIELNSFCKDNGPLVTLKKYSDYNGKYADLIDKIYHMFKVGKDVKAIIKYVETSKEMKV